MPTLIIQYSDVLCQFVLPLLGELSGLQQRHALNLLHAVIVSVAKHKVLTALTRSLLVAHADHFALADFLRRSPWAVATVRQALLQAVVQCALRVSAVVGGVVFLSLDDSLCVKTRTAEALQATAFYYDHVRERRQYKHLSRAARVVALTLEVGGIVFPLACRLYLKRAQVQAYNRRRGAQPKLVYQPTHQIAYELLAEVQALLPATLRVYVLCDAWYAATDLFKRVRQYGWHYIAASKGDRKVGRFALSEWWTHVGHQRVRYVHTHSTKGSHVYATRRVVGRLRRYPDEVVAVISYPARRRRSAPAYFVCSNPALSADTILKYYAHRWQIEVTFALLKEQLGWDDFRLQTIAGTERWLTLVWLAAAFLAVQRAEQWLAQPSQPVPTTHAIIAQQQRVQWQALVHHLYQRVQAGVPEPALLAELHLT